MVVCLVIDFGSVWQWLRAADLLTHTDLGTSCDCDPRCLFDLI
jgi:hypothetical protein